MLKITSSEDYYPTPESLLERILDGLDWEKIEYVLEPSAGKGNIVEYAQKAKEKWSCQDNWRTSKLDIDCIEIEPELRAILKDKEFRVVHDDFLTYHTYKHYDLIMMNPPFSAGARHLLKAIEIQKVSGGGIICILNAETIRNPYTNERQVLQSELTKYGAQIEYYEHAFSESERPTDVEIAVVKVEVPEPEYESRIYETLREKEYGEPSMQEESNEISEQDIVKMFVSLYNREVEWGLRLYQEYTEMKKNCLDGKSHVMLKIGTSEYNSTQEFNVNIYVKQVRGKYWEKLFQHPKIMGRLTTNLQSKYLSQIHELSEYDFSYWNIKTIQEEISRSLMRGVESSIVELFEELSYEHSYNEELKHNIHYYNGWKTNNAYKINKKVIIPLRVHNDTPFSNPHLFAAIRKLSDIEKVLNYLDNGETGEVDIDRELREADLHRNYRKIQLKYFEVTFYKKGTCHLTFTNERLLKKFNIFGSQGKHWLPYDYGKRRYEEMSAEEQTVIESFEGRESYNETLQESQYYLCGSQVLMLSAE